MKEAIGSHEGATTIRTTLLELVDSRGEVCLRLGAGSDRPELMIPADPDGMPRGAHSERPCAHGGRLHRYPAYC